MRKLLLGLAIAALLVPASVLSGEYNMISVPKLRSVWFNRLEEGLEQANKDFGVKSYQQAPAAADEAQQVRIIEDAIAQGVNALLVVPNDANSVVPAFERAKEQGIVVITHESMDQPGADFNIEMFDNKAFGRAYMEELAKFMNYEGEYVVIVGSLTVPAHNIWADSGVALQKEKYPKMKMVGDKFPAGEDRNLARQTTLDIIQTYPNLKGMFIFGSQGGPGAAQALREKRLIDKIAIVGGGTPKEVGPYIADGSMKASCLWDPAEAGRAMAYIAKVVLDGKKADIKDGFEVPGLGPITLIGNNILFNKPMIVTKENYEQYGF